MAFPEQSHEQSFGALLELLDRMDQEKVSFELSHSRSDAIMILAYLPGEHWEIEFVEYDTGVQIEIEVYRSNGVIRDAAALEEFFEKWNWEPDEEFWEQEKARGKKDASTEADG